MKKEGLLGLLKTNRIDERILEAFRKVKREDFIPEELREYAYEDIALEIGNLQTISQPSTIAFILSLLELQDNQSILEIGSGSGYLLALISEVSKNSQIYGVERINALVEKSKVNLKNYPNIKLFHEDGSEGLKEYAPYDRIIISASKQEFPYNLTKQLKENGIIVSSVKNSLFYFKKNNPDEIIEFSGFVFVPFKKGVE